MHWIHPKAPALLREGTFAFIPAFSAIYTRELPPPNIAFEIYAATRRYVSASNSILQISFAVQAAPWLS